MITANEPNWIHALPLVPGLYWRTVCTSIGSWHTSLMCVSVEEKFDGSKTPHFTEVTPAFVRQAPELIKTDIRAKGRRGLIQEEYFLGPLELPAAPAADTLQFGSNLPPEPGLYYYSYYGSDGSGWHSTLVSVSILRAKEFADQIWTVELPEIYQREVQLCQSTNYGQRLEFVPPSSLPHGTPLKFPITERSGR